jgi:hexokinase
MENTIQFLEKYRLRASDIDIKQVVDLFLDEMDKGLKGEISSLRMIPTYIEADNVFLTGVPVVAIDAGGTNFRAAMVQVTDTGKLEMTEQVYDSMPGLNGVIAKKEFFRIMAGYVKLLAEKSSRIGFCFSYATEIMPDKDGILLQFSKEVQAPEVIGELVGKNLLEALGMPEKKIVLLNDTVATLLAGKSASVGKEYDSFIGYILGTGTNTCYIEKNLNIEKKPELDSSRSQIINIESGNFSKTPRSVLDISFDNTTGNPGNYTFEKMFSGGYFGPLCLHVLKAATREKVFTDETASHVNALAQLTSEEVNTFICNNGSVRNPLSACLVNESDKSACAGILSGMIERSAKLVAANLSAVILKTGKGKTANRPILITIEGSTFYKLHQLKSMFEKFLDEFLSGENKRYVEYIEVGQSSLVGAALSVLID